MNPIAATLLVILAITIIFLGIFIPLAVVNSVYTDFVLKHSSAIKTLDEINNRYHFRSIKKYDMTHDYDNENYYDRIFPEDYLTYQLVYQQAGIAKAIEDTDWNKNQFEQYKKEIDEKCNLFSFDTDKVLKNEKKLKRIEEKCFSRSRKTPQISFSIHVRLYLTKINGRIVTYKDGLFKPSQIRELIYNVNLKNNGYYLNRETWDSICLVERGKVSNKLRFAVYARDGERCAKCGSRRNLEIDHIIPISKGGKTTLNNLQTLCHNCNMKKGSSIERYQKR